MNFEGRDYKTARNQSMISRSVLLVFFVGCLSANFCHGQKQANIWYFGQHGAGLDFNDCEPKVLTDGKLKGFEGVATISDRKTGELLFYTNSEYVWDRRHLKMPNGFLIKDGHTITQVVIVPKPKSDSLFYIFTSEIQAMRDSGIQYHVVDIRLNGGYGNLSEKNVRLYQSPVTEKLTAVRHFNKLDIWVLGHEAGTNTYFAFLVTENGVSTVPVLSRVGKIHEKKIERIGNSDVLGELKASTDGSRLAAVTYDQPGLELFDFDNKTGMISNPIAIPDPVGIPEDGYAYNYGLSFSPDNSKLYHSFTVAQPVNLIQYDLSSLNAEDIYNSRTVLFKNYKRGLYSLKLAPDGKIYVGREWDDYVGVIHEPNLPGTACNYEHNGVYLNGSKAGWGLNNFMELPLEEIHPYSDFSLGADTVLCLGETLTLDAGSIDGEYRWQDNSSESSYIVKSPGLYWVDVTRGSCSTRDTIRVEFQDRNDVSFTFSVPDLRPVGNWGNLSIPVVLEVDSNTLPVEISSLTLSVSVDPVIFIPSGVSRGHMEFSAMPRSRLIKISLQDIMLFDRKQVVTEILGTAVLDSVLFTELPVNILHLTVNNCSGVKSSTRFGSLSLDGCLLDSRRVRLHTPTAFQISPNPASGFVKVRISSEESGRFALRLLTPLGAELESLGWENIHIGNRNMQRDISFDVRSISNGLYFLVLSSPAGDVINQVVVVR